jgi:hypothetical protein
MTSTILRRSINLETGTLTTVFIAGSLSIKHLDSLVKARIDNILASGFQVVVGDADGVDASVQAYLRAAGSAHAKVYCSSSSPRNNIGGWPVEVVSTTRAKGSRAFFTAKDIRMAEIADIGLMVWDTKSTGTLSNVIELLARKKEAVVFINEDKTFKNITNVAQLEELVSHMPAPAKQQAEKKIRLTKRIESLKQEQTLKPEQASLHV